MKEINAIIQAYDAASGLGKKTALATLVHLEGSSYRGAGARMLVSDEGELTGAISGGCLEGDALRKALLAMSKQQSRLVTYDTSDEEDMSIGIQLGCAGIIQVLFEPIDPNDPHNPVQLLRKAASVRQEAVIVSLFSLSGKHDAQVGTCLLVEQHGGVTGNVPIPAISDDLLRNARNVFLNKRSFFSKYVLGDRELVAFMEYLQPPVSLIVVGAGNDAIPMTRFADTLGWEVRVIDGRNTHARPERFASACQVLVSKPEQVLDQLVVDHRTVFVMMTHNYNYDLAMLKALLPKDIPYIGMLGPKKKLQRMINDIQKGGMDVTEVMLAKLYGPTGLEIGAETPEEIALSIVSEIQAVLAGKPGTSLRDKADVIHARRDSIPDQKNMTS